MEELDYSAKELAESSGLSAATISRYRFGERIPDTESAFRNIQIIIHEKKWVIVSKNQAPAIHFLIRHPKMRNAFENMTIPIVKSVFRLVDLRIRFFNFKII